MSMGVMDPRRSCRVILGVPVILGGWLSQGCLCPVSLGVSDPSTDPRRMWGSGGCQLFWGQGVILALLVIPKVSVVPGGDHGVAGCPGGDSVLVLIPGVPLILWVPVLIPGVSELIPGLPLISSVPVVILEFLVIPGAMASRC